MPALLTVSSVQFFQTKFRVFPFFLVGFKLLNSACGILHIASSLIPFIYLSHVSASLHQGLDFPAVSFVWGLPGCFGLLWLHRSILDVCAVQRSFLQTTRQAHGSPVTHTMEWALSSSLLTIQDWVKYHFFRDTLSSVPFPDLVFHFPQLMAVPDSLLFSAVNSRKSPTTASLNIVDRVSRCSASGAYSSCP